ncbi:MULTISPECIES: ParB/RepB/Spo0J family partition protein [Streptomyces]|uniref:ParB/RepB/Spo0J family partition protein n=1 Tax=Streptomyces TaxID=1883 RepID=UPI00345BC1D2
MTRVADQLGTGASFARTRGGVSARRQAVATTTGAPTTGAPDSRLRTLPLTQLVPTRFNPRRKFGSEEELRDFGLKLGKKQLQPAVAVTREAYLKLWPDEAEALGTAPYVIANGERRWRASHAAGLLTLDVVVDDEVAKSRADFLDAVLSENNDREDLDPIERALGIQTMVEELDGKAKVAEYYGKSGGWVTQQMYLLDLTPDLQDLVSAGQLPVRETRTLVKLPHDEQVAAWKARCAEREQEKTQPRPSRQKKRTQSQPSPDDAESGKPSGAGSFTAVKKPEQLPRPQQTAGQGPEGAPPTGVPAQTAGSPETSPAQQPASKDSSDGEDDGAPESSEASLQGTILIPSCSPAEIVDALAERLSAEQLTAVAEILLDRVASVASTTQA